MSAVPMIPPSAALADPLEAQLQQLAEAIRRIPALELRAGPLPAVTQFRRITILSEAELHRQREYFLLTRMETSQSLPAMLRIFAGNGTRDPRLVVSRSGGSRTWGVAVRGARQRHSARKDSSVKSLPGVPRICGKRARSIPPQLKNRPDTDHSNS